MFGDDIDMCVLLVHSDSHANHPLRWMLMCCFHSVGSGGRDSESGGSDSESMVVPYSFTNRDVILYALGGMSTCHPPSLPSSLSHPLPSSYHPPHISPSVGAAVSQTDTSELKFLFEGHEDFSTIPSFAVLPAMVPTVQCTSTMCVHV